MSVALANAEGGDALAVARALLFDALLAAGSYTMRRREFMALSLPLGEAEFDGLVGAVAEFVSARASLLR